MTLPPDRDCASQIIVRGHYEMSPTIVFIAFKKLYHQFSLKL